MVGQGIAGCRPGCCVPPCCWLALRPYTQTPPLTQAHARPALRPLPGGDKSGVAVCSTGAGDWRWSSAVEAGAVPDRSMHAAASAAGQIVVVGGASLADGNELGDVACLARGPEGWAWKGGWAGRRGPARCMRLPCERQRAAPLLLPEGEAVV
jgi:hypothetical protein